MSEDPRKPEAFTRRGAAFWRNALAAQRQSGLSARKFCRREALPFSTFYRWSRRLESEERDPASSIQADFVPIQIRPPSGGRESAGSFELIFPEGLRLKVPVGADAGTLKTILQTLGQVV